MSTEFAISRFLVPELVKRSKQPKPWGWAIFTDCDVLFRGSITPMIAALQDAKAVYCVKHEYKPAQDIKMDGQIQVAYPRKNWSSVMAINIDHPANAALSVEMVNALPGRDLHRFCWLNDKDIGGLSPTYNYLVGETQAKIRPTIVHFTLGCPTMPGCSGAEYADEWWDQLDRWAA